MAGSVDDLAKYTAPLVPILGPVADHANAAAASAEDAATSAGSAIDALNEFRGRNYGPLPEDPLVDPFGNPPKEGDEYWNTVSRAARRFDGLNWITPNPDAVDLGNPLDPAKGVALVARAMARVEAIMTASVTGLRNGDVVYAKGRASADDAGGGMFTYYANSTQPPDGGFVFQPAAGSGRFIRAGWTVLGLGGSVKTSWFGTKGDLSVDDWAAAQAAVDVAGPGGTVVFPKTTVNKYKISKPLKFYAGQTWVGSGGVDVLGLGTEIRLSAPATSVAEPATPASTTYGFSPVGIYFNAQAYGDVGISLYNTSYGKLDQCAARADKAGAAAFLLDSDTSKQCYFNQLNMPRAFAVGVGGVGIRFTRGANANQVFGGKCGSSTRGMEFLSLSSGNIIVGTDFEDNTVGHVYVDSPNNVFIAGHMETAPVGFDITANGGNTVRIGTSFATNVVTQVRDLSKLGAALETRNDPSGQMGDFRFGPARGASQYLTPTSFVDYDLDLFSAAANALIRFFKNTSTSGECSITLFKGDGSATQTIKLNGGTGQFQCNSILQGNGSGIFNNIIRAAAPPSSGTYAAGDRTDRTNPSSASPVVTWGCYAGGTSGGSWQSTSWFVFKGPTVSRPNLNAAAQGVMYLDTTLAPKGKPIIWTGVEWVDMNGAAV